MTHQVAILAESSANLPSHLIEKYQIEILPLKLNWGDESLRDGIDITAEAVYQRQQEEDYFPMTNTFSPGELKEAVERAAVWATDVLAILLSKRLTSSFTVANLVQAMDLPIPLHILDSKTAAMAQGFVVLEAARAAANGLAINEVMARAAEIAGKVRFIAAIETLKYLQRTGRVSWPQAALGSAFKITPIVALEPGSGVVAGIARPRTWKRACERLLKIMAEDVSDLPVHAAVSHAHHPDSAADLAERITSQFDVKELYINHLTPVMGAAAGPVLGIAYYVEGRT